MIAVLQKLKIRNKNTMLKPALVSYEEFCQVVKMYIVKIYGKPCKQHF